MSSIVGAGTYAIIPTAQLPSATVSVLAASRASPSNPITADRPISDPAAASWLRGAYSPDKLESLTEHPLSAYQTHRGTFPAGPFVLAPTSTALCPAAWPVNCAQQTPEHLRTPHRDLVCVDVVWHKHSIAFVKTHRAKSTSKRCVIGEF